YIPETSQKSKTGALLLLLFFEWISFGFVGLHDFYVGKIMQGLVKFILRIAAFSVDEFSVKCLLLFIVGIWQLIDFIMIIMGVYKDKHGLPLKNSNW
ncbi:MAG: TM2 domain-containing protein, partial [Treponema sp.]|nr:TM2 domain-containing protein [Candidatus Treponema equifaecale]